MSSASSSQPDKKRRVWSNQSVALASAIDSCVPQTEGTAPSALKRKRYSYCADLYNQVTSSAKHKGSLQSLDWGNDFGVLTSKDLPGAESDLFKQYKVSIFSLVASPSVSCAIIVGLIFLFQSLLDLYLNGQKITTETWTHHNPTLQWDARSV
jgi:hypothetical protein